MILSQDDKPGTIVIDCNGPEGNVFSLIALAKDLSKRLNRECFGTYDFNEISKDMMSSDYDHAVEVLDKHFGELLTIYK